MSRRQPSSTDNSCYGHVCKPRNASYAFNVVLSWQCCHVLRACRSRDSNYIPQETKRIVLKCFSSMFPFVRLSNTQPSAAVHICRRCQRDGLLSRRWWYYKLHNIRGFRRWELSTETFCVYVGRQNNIWCSTSINLFTVLRGFHERRVLRSSPPKKKTWELVDKQLLRDSNWHRHPNTGSTKTLIWQLVRTSYETYEVKVWIFPILVFLPLSLLDCRLSDLWDLSAFFYYLKLSIFPSFANLLGNPWYKPWCFFGSV